MTTRSQDNLLRVLVVDDSRFMRRMIQRIVENSGEFRVVAEAADGEEAIALVRQAEPDVVTVDVNMPGMGGIEMIRRLREESDVPIVVVTALPPSFDGLSDRMTDLGVSEIVTKSVGERSLDISLFADELLAALSRAAHKEART